MDIRISKTDIVISYVAQLFMIGTGFIMLPMILKFLSAEEMGLYYIFLSIDSIIILVDMGFSSQFSRNITYVLSGAQKLEKEGVSMEYSEKVNERLLSCTLQTSRRIYKIMSVMALIPLLTLGSFYIKQITKDQHIENLSIIWLVFCISIFFNLYYYYLNAYLGGRGMIKETKLAQIWSKLCYIFLCSSMLILGYGLLSVAISGLISPFVYRYLAHKSFYNNYFKEIETKYKITWNEVKQTFQILFFNAKRLGIISILGTAIGHASTLIIGSFLPLKTVGSYGLLVQLTALVATFSTSFFTSMIPEFASLMVKQKWEEVREKFGLSLFVFYIFQIVGFIGLLIAPLVFNRFAFNTQLPSYGIIISYSIYRFFEVNQSLFSQLLIANNDFIFYHSAIYTGLASICLLLAFLSLDMGLPGVIASYSIPLYLYAAWRWPLYVRKKYVIDYEKYVFSYSIERIKNIVHNK